MDGASLFFLLPPAPFASIQFSVFSSLFCSACWDAVNRTRECVRDRAKFSSSFLLKNIALLFFIFRPHVRPIATDVWRGLCVCL